MVHVTLQRERPAFATSSPGFGAQREAVSPTKPVVYTRKASDVTVDGVGYLHLVHAAE